MFEKEIERIVNLSTSRSIGNSGKISVKEVLATDIPIPIRTLIRHEVELQLKEELHGKFLNSKFNYSHPEILSLQNQINSLLVINYVFERDDYLELIKDSVHLCFNYLVRPHWTLTNYLFDNSSQVSTDSVISTLHQFSAYNYLKEIVIRFISEKNIQLINLQEFRTILFKADREYIKRRNGFQIAQIVTAIYEFINFGAQDIHSPILTKGLIKYFEDKGLKTISDRLMIELKRNVESISLTDLGSILEDLHKEYGEFEFNETDYSEEFGQPKIEIKKEKKDPETAKLELTESIEINLVPLEELIGNDERKRFIKRIFRKNENDYVNAIAELNATKSWKDASVYIDEIFIMNDIDPYIPDAVRFTEITYQKFFPKSRT